jgi:xanthine dehydrogenase accessory factor
MNDRVLLGELLAAVDAGTPVVLATVVATERSVPRHAGSKMLVFADGSQRGTIGGGEMEGRVVAEARAALADGQARLLPYTLVDPASGDPGVCGGTLQIYVEPYMPTPTVYVVGCGHVGKAIVDLAHWLGFRVVATDDRADLADPASLPLADAVVAGAIEAALAAHPVTSETHVVVVTRNVAVDLEILPALVRTPARTIGVMGSRRRWSTTAAELRRRGLTDDDLARISSPIGLELEAETPEEIALSVMAQIVAHRRSGGAAAPGRARP